MTHLARTKVVLAVATSICGILQATVYRTNTVDGLVHLLGTYTTSSDTVELESGDYDLTGVQMESSGSKYGKSHLVLSGVLLRGAGDSPNDVRLIGDGTCRVLRMIPDTYARLQNLTITNGYAKAMEGASDSKHGGGIYGYPTVTNCVIVGCKADGNGGGTYGYTYIRKCRILNNTANQGGGVYQPNEVINSVVSGNHSTSHGGGIYGNGSGRAVGSTVIGNVAGGAGGGVCAVNMVTNCIFSQNTATSGGGAMYSWGRADKFAYDCTICSNKTTTNGTVVEYSIVGGTIFANYAQNGGGARNCTLDGVEIHDNYATGSGGGLSDCSASDCVLRNNISASAGPNVSGGTLTHCDISGTTCYKIVATGCRFHDIGQEVELSGNSYSEATFKPVYILNDYLNCTNCLFYGNVAARYDASIFGGNSGGSTKSHLVNCTIVSNSYPYVFKYFKTAAANIEVVNCVFWGNTAYDGVTSRDISMGDMVTSDGVSLSYCAYGTSNVVGLDDYVDEALYQFGANGFGANPKFVMDEDATNPYALKTASPLIGRGKVLDWMSSATDIRGEGFARIRDKKVDIGCYQCWLTHPGLMITFH